MLADGVCFTYSPGSQFPYHTRERLLIRFPSCSKIPESLSLRDPNTLSRGYREILGDLPGDTDLPPAALLTTFRGVACGPLPPTVSLFAFTATL